MLKIRLQRTGRKHEPTFRVVLTDSQNSTKSGKFLEILGNHDPRRKQDTQLKEERIKFWIEKGAQPSDTIHNLLVENKVIKGEKINVLPKKTPIVKEKTEEEIKAEQVKEEVPAEEVAETPVEESPKEEVVETPAEQAPTEAEVSVETPSEETQATLEVGKEEEVK